MKTVCSKKGLCIIFAIMMMISGMCFTGMKADSLFNYMLLQRDSSVILAPPAFSIEEQSSVDELSGMSLINTIMERTSELPMEISVKSGMVLFLQAVLPKGFQYHTGMIRRLADQSAESRNIIVRYIHQKDGLKDIIPNSLLFAL